MHYMGPSESDKSEIPARRQMFWGNEGWARLQSSKRDTTKKTNTHHRLCAQYPWTKADWDCDYVPRADRKWRVRL